MPKRNYSSTTVVRTLAAAMTSSTSGAVGTMVLDSTATVPTSYPFTMVIDPDTVSEEIVTVTGAPTGASYPITRGSDSTTATSHLNGSYVRHMVTARDLQEPQDHIYASANVHGLGATSSVVGTTDTQELTNKTINGGTLTGTLNAPSGVISGVVINNGYVAGTLNNVAGTISNGVIDTATLTNSNLTGSTVTNGTIVGSVTNSGTIVGGTYTTPTIASIKNAAGNAYITDTDANFTVGSNGSIINKSYFYQLGSARTLANVTTVQSIFGKVLTLPETGPANTLYHFEAKFRLINGTTSHSVYFQLGGKGTGTISMCDMTLWSCDVAAAPANASVGVTEITSATSTQEIITSSVTGGTFVTVIGTFSATSGATLDPCIKFTVAPGASPVPSIPANAYVKVTPIATWTSGADTSRGTWNTSV